MSATRNPGKPLTNAEIKAMEAETAAKFATRGATIPPPQPTMKSYSLGRYSLVWVADRRVPTEVRDEQGSVVYRGDRDECRAWLESRGVAVPESIPVY